MSKEILQKVKALTDDELKAEFIKYFGEEKWNQEEALAKLWPVQLALCEYLGLEPIPVVVEDIEEDSRYYTHELYIAISKDKIGNEVEALKCLIHEYKHYQQHMCIIYNIIEVPHLKQWKEDFESNCANANSYEELICQSVEVDASAFSKYIMEKWFDIKTYHPDPVYDEILTRYIKKYF